jgi:hypothetical protein
MALLQLSAPGRWAQAYAMVIAAGFAFFLANTPVQLPVATGNLVDVARLSWDELARIELASEEYFRPLLLAQLKPFVDLLPGHVVLLFRGLHVIQVFACVWLFVRLLRVQTTAQLVAATIAVTVLTGSHTFAGTVHEAYPINNYLTVVVCSLVVLNIQMGERSRWPTDVLAIAALVLALGTVETGLLVWGCLFVGMTAGWRGVSRRALAAATLIVGSYFAIRFALLDVGTPGLDAHASGYLLRRLEPGEVVARFGDWPWRFYAYNVLASISTVLFAEPRGGVWLIVRDWQAGEAAPWAYINVAASTGATLLIAWYCIRREWWCNPARWSHGQRLVVVAASVLVANAAISYPYTKDQIMAVAGVMFALALYAAAADLAAHSSPRLPARAFAAALLTVVSCTWSWRVLGVQHNLVHTAFISRNEWASLTAWRREYPGVQADPQLAALVSTLQMSACARPVPNPQSRPSRFERYFDHHTD